MYVCNTGLDCDERLGGCEANLEIDDFEMAMLEHDMLVGIEMMSLARKNITGEKAYKQALQIVKEDRNEHPRHT